MADYAKTAVTETYSKVSTYSSPKVATTMAPYEYTPSVYSHEEVSAATGGGTTVSLAKYATIDHITIHNNDPANYVTATYKSVGGGAAAQTARVAAGKFGILPDVDPAAANLVLAANGAPLECEIFIAGTGT